MKRTVLAVLVLLLVAGVACAPPPTDEAPSAVSDRSSALLPIRNARIPLEGVLSGGQPTPEQIEAAARAGFRTVINLRTDQEQGFEWEAQSVEKLGMQYVQVPVEGSQGLTRENVERIDTVLRESLENGPVLLHCGSGNRIGAVLALRAAWLDGVEPAAALDYGLASGLTRLEGPTREILGLPQPETSPAPE